MVEGDEAGNKDLALGIVMFLGNWVNWNGLNRLPLIWIAGEERGSTFSKRGSTEYDIQTAECHRSERSYGI